MAKETGLGDRYFMGALEFSGDIQQLGSIGGGPAALNVTGINKSAMERLGGQRDGRFEYTAYFNPDGLGAGFHQVANDLPTTDVQLAYFHGAAIGSPAAFIIGKEVNYDGTRADDGMFTFSLTHPANGFGLEWTEIHTALLRTDTVPTNGAGVDGTGVGSTAFGLQAYLIVQGFTGTSVTIKLQESSDNGVGDAFADVAGGAFTAVTSGFQVQRIATAGNLTVERYLRVVTTGTFSSAAFVVGVARNFVAPAF